MKEQVIDEIFRAVESTNSTMLHEQMSATKISFMDANGGFYTVTITKHKSQPDGYTGGIKNKFVEKAEAEALVEVE